MEPAFHHYNSTMSGAGPVSNNNNSQQNSGNQGMTAPFFFLIILIVVLAAFFCFNSPCFRRLSGHNEPQPQQRPPRPRPRRESTASDVEAGLNRMEFVKSNLPYRTVEIGDEESGYISANQNPSNRSLKEIAGIDDAVEGQLTKAEQPTRPSPVSQSSTSQIPVCSICLSSYHKGDEVACSTNPSCLHEYHRDCIQDWLLSHEDCPLCRHVFLSKGLTESISHGSDSTVSSSTEHEEELNGSSEVERPIPHVAEQPIPSVAEQPIPPVAEQPIPPVAEQPIPPVLTPPEV